MILESSASKISIIDSYIEKTSPLVLEMEESGNDKAWYLSGPFQRSDSPNSNNRVYPRSVLDSNVTELQESIKTNQVLVEMDHPKSDEGPSVWKTIGIVTELNKCDSNGYVHGKIKLADPNENEGSRHLISLMKLGVKPGISSRGTSRTMLPCVERKTGSDGKTYDYITDNFKLITFDVVANPSVTDARTAGCFENETSKGNIMTREERIAMLRKLFQESSFEDVWSIFQETGMSSLMAKVSESIFQSRKADIDKMVADRVAEEQKKLESGFEGKVKEASEKLAEEMFEAEGSIVLDILSLLKANALVDETGKVPEGVWNEAQAQWGASIDNDLFSGKKRMPGTVSRTKIPAAGSIHKEDALDVQSVIDQLQTMVKNTVNDAISAHPGIAESTATREKRELREKVLSMASAQVKDQIAEQVCALYDSGLRCNEDQLRTLIDTQTKLIEANKTLTSTGTLNVTPGVKGTSIVDNVVKKQTPINEAITASVKQLFG